jgi:hypothetical protein
MIHPMNISLEAELEYRRARLVRTGHSLPLASRGTRRAAARTEQASRRGKAAISSARAA